MLYICSIDCVCALVCVFGTSFLLICVSCDCVLFFHIDVMSIDMFSVEAQGEGLFVDSIWYIYSRDTVYIYIYITKSKSVRSVLLKLLAFPEVRFWDGVNWLHWFPFV